MGVSEVMEKRPVYFMQLDG